MEDFHKQFSLDAAENLKNLQKKLERAEEFSDSERREVFRTLHTIKGTAQTLGFSAASRLANELENVLSAEKFITTENFRSLFKEGISLLIKSFDQKKESDSTALFFEKIHRTIPENLQSGASFEILLPEIPIEFVECLSQTEKIALDSALKLGKNIYCFEISFDKQTFADKLIKCREDLTEKGEIIATFPGAKIDSEDAIGFRILCASLADKAQIETIAENYAATITFDVSPEKFTKDLRGVAAKAVAHGKDLCGKLGKKIDFKVSAEEINVSGEKLKLVFDVLIHLIRNAVDHGIGDVGGQISVNLTSAKNGLDIVVEDDGNGVNLKNLRAKAVEKKMISADKILTEQATRDLVFQSELSTAPEITEISGRGIGLDAVKTSVEKSGGTIKVESRTGKGTTFEVFLPQ